QIDNQLELVRLHDRKVGRLRALEDASAVDADVAVHIREAGAVAHQPASLLDKFTHGVARGERVARRQVHQLEPPRPQEWSGATKRASGRSRTSVAKATSAPRAAMQPLRRRVWLRIFVVRYGLPCDPPVGGPSCNGEGGYHTSIARFVVGTVVTDRPRP